MRWRGPRYAVDSPYGRKVLSDEHCDTPDEQVSHHTRLATAGPPRRIHISLVSQRRKNRSECSAPASFPKISQHFCPSTSSGRRSLPHLWLHLPHPRPIVACISNPQSSKYSRRAHLKTYTVTAFSMSISAPARCVDVEAASTHVLSASTTQRMPSAPSVIQ